MAKKTKRTRTNYKRLFDLATAEAQRAQIKSTKLETALTEVQDKHDALARDLQIANDNETALQTEVNDLERAAERRSVQDRQAERMDERRAAQNAKREEFVRKARQDQFAGRRLNAAAALMGGMSRITQPDPVRRAQLAVKEADALLGALGMECPQ